MGANIYWRLRLGEALRYFFPPIGRAQIYRRIQWGGVANFFLTFLMWAIFYA